MYDELIGQLRNFAVELRKAEDALLVRDAADVIEELSVVVRAQKAVIDKLAQQLRLETENGEV